QPLEVLGIGRNSGVLHPLLDPAVQARPLIAAEVESTVLLDEFEKHLELGLGPEARIGHYETLSSSAAGVTSRLRKAVRIRFACSTAFRDCPSYRLAISTCPPRRNRSANRREKSPFSTSAVSAVHMAPSSASACSRSSASSV